MTVPPTELWTAGARDFKVTLAWKPGVGKEPTSDFTIQAFSLSDAKRRAIGLLKTKLKSSRARNAWRILKVELCQTN